MILTLAGIVIEVSWWAVRGAVSTAYALYRRQTRANAEQPLLLTDGSDGAGSTDNVQQVQASLTSVRAELAETRVLLTQLLHDTAAAQRVREELLCRPLEAQSSNSP